MKEVYVRLGEGLRAEVSAGSHRILAGEPVAAGGDDAGPDPYALLLSALGSCVALTLRLYADRKGWPLQSASVRLQHDRIHVRDCTECTEEDRERGGWIDRIEKFVHLEGDLDDEQRARLLDIAGRCPVERTLSRGPRIVTRAE